MIAFLALLACMCDCSDPPALGLPYPTDGAADVPTDAAILVDEGIADDARVLTLRGPEGEEVLLEARVADYSGRRVIALTPDEPLAPSSVHELLRDGTPLSTFTTGNGPTETVPTVEIANATIERAEGCADNELRVAVESQHTLIVELAVAQGWAGSIEDDPYHLVLAGEVVLPDCITGLFRIETEVRARGIGPNGEAGPWSETIVLHPD